MFSRNFAEISTSRWQGDKYGIFWSVSGSRR